VNTVTKFFDAVYWFFMTICKLFFIAMVGITAFVVFNRYVIKSSLVWGEPVVLMCMVYMSLCSAALAIRKDTHIRMQIIDYFAPKQFIRFVRGAAHVTIFAFGIFMIVYGWKFSMLAKRNLMTGVGITSMWLYLACPFAGVAVVLMEIERFINFCHRVAHGQTLDMVTLAIQSQQMAEEAKQELAMQKEENS
jgi:TRAP-type C4-dicarboxylate transport system permease small subunit